MKFDDMHFDCANVYDEHAQAAVRHPYGNDNRYADGPAAAATAGEEEVNARGAAVVVVATNGSANNYNHHKNDEHVHGNAAAEGNGISG